MLSDRQAEAITAALVGIHDEMRRIRETIAPLSISVERPSPERRRELLLEREDVPPMRPTDRVVLVLTRRGVEDADVAINLIANALRLQTMVIVDGCATWGDFIRSSEKEVFFRRLVEGSTASLYVVSDWNPASHAFDVVLHLDRDGRWRLLDGVTERAHGRLELNIDGVTLRFTREA